MLSEHIIIVGTCDIENSSRGPGSHLFAAICRRREIYLRFVILVIVLVESTSSESNDGKCTLEMHVYK